MPILITDFDGTFTGRDFFDLILERHDPPGARAAWRRYLDGETTHCEGIGGVFASLRVDERAAAELVDALDPAPGTADAVRRLQAAGWQLAIASAGCRWYIDRLLEKLGVSLTVHAAPGVFTPETGLVMRPDPQAPYFHPAVCVDKPAIVRDALLRDPVVAFAGDSDTDRAAALLVEPERRFAKGWLSRRFTDEGVPHHALRVWPEIADRLLG